MIDEGQIRVMQGFGRFEPLPPFCPHVYSAVKAREEADAAPRGIERSEEDMAITNGGSEGEIPPMHKPPVRSFGTPREWWSKEIYQILNQVLLVLYVCLNFISVKPC